MSSNLTQYKPQISLVSNSDLKFYQTNDGFFAPNDICKDFGLNINDFFEFGLTKIKLFFELEYTENTSTKNITDFVSNYPELCKYQKANNNVNSGFWLSIKLLEPFKIWLADSLEKKWNRYLSPEESYQNFSEIPKSSYLRKLGFSSIESIKIRNQDLFVYCPDIFVDKIEKLFDDNIFLKSLIRISKQLELDLNANLLQAKIGKDNWKKAIYLNYKQLIKIIQIGNKQTIWLHPDLAIEYYGEKSLVACAIKNRRNFQDYQQTVIVDITNEFDRFCESNKTNLNEIFEGLNAGLFLWENQDNLYFSIHDKNLNWQYFYDLVNNQFLIENIEKTSEMNYFQCNFLNHPRFEKLIAFKPNIDAINGKSFSSSIPKEIHISGKIIQNFHDKYLKNKDIDLIRHELNLLGYKSLYYKEKIELAQSEYIIWTVNDVEIRQRSRDGFIDATAMASSYGKNLANWMRLDSTWNLFVARANQLGIKFNCTDQGNSDYTRVGDIFSTLIERKQGSPLSGGGTWLDPKLCIHLSMWLDTEFGLIVSDLVLDWLSNQNRSS